MKKEDILNINRKCSQNSLTGISIIHRGFINWDQLSVSRIYLIDKCFEANRHKIDDERMFGIYSCRFIKGYTVSETCRLMGMSQHSYYEFLHRLDYKIMPRLKYNRYKK